MHSIFEKMNQLGRDQVPFLFILDYELIRPMVFPLKDIDDREIAYKIGRWSNQSPSSQFHPSLDFGFNPLPKPVFQLAFEQIQREIHSGNTYLTNLCFRMPISLNWSLKTLFAQASAKYKLRYRDEFVFFSPETFIKISDRVLSTFPMKGTIDARLPNAPTQLLNDSKEDAEHATIVDLLRNDLSQVARKVRLKRFKYLDLVETNRGALWQMSSEIQGILPPNYPAQIGTILEKLLPAGSITGAPKPKTLEIISQVESHTRGFYTGVAGIFDGQSLDSAVMIRFVEKEKGLYYYRSGGGITAQSSLDKEYDELLNKIYIPTPIKHHLVESIGLQNGRFEHLDWHQKRMDRTRQELFGLSPVSLVDLLVESLKKYDFGSQRMKCRVIYERKVERLEWIPYFERKITTLRLVSLPSLPEKVTRYKWANRAIYQDLLAQKGTADEVLIVRNGEITDISYANVALYDGQHWWTPKHPLLAGTARARLLAEGKIRERRILAKDLDDYQKIRIFNAMIPWERAKDVMVFDVWT